MEKKEKQALEKFNDPIWRLSHLYQIKTKDKQIRPIKPNNAQMEYLSNESNRDMILKARQLGFTTLKALQLLDYAIFNKNVSCALIAHKRDTVTVLFEIIRLAYDKLPADPRIKPKTSYENRNELYFPDLNSKIFVALDTRGETIHNLHVSELAFVENAEEKMLGILESVPKDGIISFESTANGMSGYFFETWEDEKNEFRKHFYNWMLDPDYTEHTELSMEGLEMEYRPLQIRYELIPEINVRYNLSMEQFAWYIAKVRRHKHKTPQEYPTNEEEAFVASGRNVFHISDLKKHETRDPIDRLWGDLLVWEKPLKGFLYTIGCDPAEGIGEDNSVIEVLNAHTGEQVAEFATNSVKPDILAGYLMEIGNYYNKGFIVLEINNHGLAVLNAIKHKYYNIYRREVFDKNSREYKQALGWQTSQRTKPLLIDALEEAIRVLDVKINSVTTIKELKTFVQTDEQGKQGFGAEGSNKDDRVIALGLAFQGIKHLPKMKRPKTQAEVKLEEYIEKKKAEVAGLLPAQPSHVQKKRYKIRGH